jgi:ABC-type phosphate transport system ATPase subunit
MKVQAAADAFKLMDIDLKFKTGQLNVIVGPTGSGKTSLLMALLGEMTKLKGNVYLPGGISREDLRPDPETGLTESVAYCAQQAWLVNGTVKDNIVFAGDWDPKRYEEVIVACSLKRDIEILDAGDQTIVGEKGVTLSGGQKQRISLLVRCTAKHVTYSWMMSSALSTLTPLSGSSIMLSTVSLCSTVHAFSLHTTSACVCHMPSSELSLRMVGLFPKEPQMRLSILESLLRRLPNLGLPLAEPRNRLLHRLLTSTAKRPMVRPALEMVLRTANPTAKIPRRAATVWKRLRQRVG